MVLRNQRRSSAIWLILGIVCLLLQAACGTQAVAQSVAAETRENWIALRDAVGNKARPLTDDEKQLVALIVKARHQAMVNRYYVWGKVTDEDGKPITQVDVEARYELNPTPLPKPNAEFKEVSVRTNEMGHYELPINSPFANLRCYHKGYYIERYVANDEPLLDAKLAIDSIERGEPDPRLDEFVLGINVELLKVGDITLLDCRKGGLEWYDGRSTTRFTYEREDRQRKLHQLIRPSAGFATIDQNANGERPADDVGGQGEESISEGFYIELSVDATGHAQTEKVTTPYQQVRITQPKELRLHAEGEGYGIAPIGDRTEAVTHRTIPVLKEAPVDGYKDVIVFNATDIYRWSTDGGPWFYVMANGKYGVARIRSFERNAVPQSDQPAYRLTIEFEIQPKENSRNVEMLR